ncbi:hypothetical protein M2159_006406 [Streptomyces sp. SAI-090]|nr:hypothetical protein [Streptomyces sp. SAI-090]
MDAHCWYGRKNMTCQSRRTSHEVVTTSQTIAT